MVLLSLVLNRGALTSQSALTSPTQTGKHLCFGKAAFVAIITSYTLSFDICLGSHDCESGVRRGSNSLGKAALQYWCYLKAVGNTHRVDAEHSLEWLWRWRWVTGRAGLLSRCIVPEIFVCQSSGPVHTGIFLLP